MKDFYNLRARLAARHTREDRPDEGWLRRGLTLVELSIVILVLGILMTVLFVNLDLGVTDKAKTLQVKNASKQLKIWWDQYEYENDQLEEGASLAILAEKNPDNPGWRPIDENLVMDPWKEPYFICLDDNGERQICSLGADKQDGGEGTNSDYYLTDKSTWPSWLSGKKVEQ